MHKIISLIIALAITPLAFAMHEEAAEPETKRQRAIVPQPPEMPFAPELQPILGDLVKQKFVNDYAQWVQTEDPSQVTLQSNDDTPFILPIRMALQSKTISGIIEDNGIENPIPLPNIDTKTLAILVKLMEIIDRFQMMQQQDELFYIPRALQPVLNEILASASPILLAELFNATDYLDHPFILNGVAAVIVNGVPEAFLDQVQTLLTVKSTESKHRESRINAALSLLAESDTLATIDAINEAAYPWILKHIAHRESRIKQEYSIADYIKEHGQPPVEILESEHELGDQSSISFWGVGLTSLYGIGLVHNKDQIQELHITYNCLFNVEYDPQPAKNPFDGFPALRVLLLTDNNLKALQPQFFKGASSVEVVDLEGNDLATIQIDTFSGLKNLELLSLVHNRLNRLQLGSFNGASTLRRLDLTGNRLESLPVGLYKRLSNLRKLGLGHNRLPEEEKQRIRAEFPDGIEIEFNQELNVPY